MKEPRLTYWSLLGPLVSAFALLCGACVPEQTAGHEPLIAIAEPVVFMVTFEPSSSELSGEAEEVLDQAVEYCVLNEPRVVSIVGHYDTSGTEDYADQMSRQMAETVRDYMVKMGVPAKSIKLLWRGEREQAIPTEDGVAEKYNRRVEVSFTY